MLAMLPTAVWRLPIYDDVASAPLPPHLAPGMRRRSAIALCLGKVFMFFRATTFKFVANNETLQQASAHPCSLGWDSGHPLPLLFLLPPFLQFSCSCRYSISLLFECTDARSRARGRRSIRCQRAPLRAEYSNFPCTPQAKKNHERAVMPWANT
jgi:hypothetical protein